MDVSNPTPIQSPWATASAKRNFARFQVQFGFRRRAKHKCALAVEFTSPSCNHNCRQTIADHVHASASHVHQFINAVAWAVWERFFSCRPKRGLAGREMDLL